jgi:maleamate amidohydrolase
MTELRNDRTAAYVPDLIPASDRAMYIKGGFGQRIGFGQVPAVLIVDATRAFVEDEFPLGSSRRGRPAIAAIRRLLDAARAAHTPIFFTRMEPFKTRTEAGRWFEASPSALADPGDHRADEGASIPTEISPLEGEVVITKPKPSAFFGTQLQSMLVMQRVDTLIVAGMVTSGCVRATVEDGFAYNYRVIVPIECVSDRAEVPHQVNLFDMGMLTADVIPLELVVDYLAERTT